jgi:hypothetical protein
MFSHLSTGWKKNNNKVAPWHFHKIKGEIRMIKTVEQYLESLNDGREVWCLGEKVADVRTHPTISTIIRMASMDYVLPNHPDYRDLFVTQEKMARILIFCLPLRKRLKTFFEGGNAIQSESDLAVE